MNNESCEAFTESFNYTHKQTRTHTHMCNYYKFYMGTLAKRLSIMLLCNFLEMYQTLIVVWVFYNNIKLVNKNE